jgi:UDP-N-acetyl-D-mannosaminuronate dehydrogenase
MACDEPLFSAQESIWPLHWRKGRASFVETGLAALVKKYVKAGRLKVTGDAVKAVSQSDIVFIVVATVVDEKRKPDRCGVAFLARSFSVYMGPGRRRRIPSRSAGG